MLYTVTVTAVNRYSNHETGTTVSVMSKTPEDIQTFFSIFSGKLIWDEMETHVDRKEGTAEIRLINHLS